MREADPSMYRASMNARYVSLVVPIVAANIAGAVVAIHGTSMERTMIAEAGAIFGAALVSSIAGFAFAALAGALLFHGGGTPLHIVQLIIINSIVIQTYSLVWLRKSIRWTSLRPYLLGGIVGLPAGLFLLYHVEVAIYLRGLGAFLIAYGAYMLLHRPLVLNVDGKPGTLMDALAGALGGITGGFAGFPGAFVTIWCSQRGWDKVRQRAITQPYILVMQIITLAVLGVLSQSLRASAPIFDTSVLLDAPCALAGAFIGIHLFRRITDVQFQRVICALLVASGVSFIHLH
jgi:uncharacterized membrane protein YfcA